VVRRLDEVEAGGLDRPGVLTDSARVAADVAEGEEDAEFHRWITVGLVG
jgi:hypothetical protein